jgi:hypothetical protein
VSPHSGLKVVIVMPLDIAAVMPLIGTISPDRYTLIAVKHGRAVPTVSGQNIAYINRNKPLHQAVPSTPLAG